MNKYFTLSIIFFQFLNFSFFSQSTSFKWAKQMGGAIDQRGTAITTDAVGNVYTTGWFIGTADFDPGPGTINFTGNSSTGDCFISKLNKAGNLVWVKQIGGGAGSDVGVSIVTDASSNVYITGDFKGTVDFDPGIGTNTISSVANSQDMFILKLDSLGNFIWVKQIGGNSSSDRVFDLELDKNKDLYIIGDFQNTVDFDPGMNSYNLTPITNVDGFILKLDSIGNFIWAKQIDCQVRNMTTDALGNKFFTGDFGQTVDFDSGLGVSNMTSLPAGSVHIFILKLDSADIFSWVKQFEANSNYSRNGISIATDVSGNVYSIGQYYGGTMDFDPGPNVYNLSTTNTQIYISKLDKIGNFVWAKQFNATGSSYVVGNSVKLDRYANVYVTGLFGSGGTINFSPGIGTNTLTAIGNQDMYIAKLDSSGSFIWVKRIAGTGSFTSAKAYDITIDPLFNIYTTGDFNNTIDFNPDAGINNLISYGQYDAFVQKMGQCITPLPPKNTTSLFDLSICNDSNTILSASGVGILNWYTTPTGGVFLGTGANLTTNSLTSTTTFYVQDSLCNAGMRTAITVTVNPLVTSQISSQANVTCNGVSNGSVTLSAYGGYNFNYSWSNTGSNVASIDSLGAGTYTCLITNMCGNQSTQTITITEPQLLNINTSLSDIICLGGIATVTVNAFGGSAPYNGVGTYTVMAGINNFTVTDNYGCISASSLTITEPPLIVSSQTANVCYGQSFVVGSNTYSLSGIYNDVIASLINGCDSSITTNLNIENPLDISTNITGFNISSNATDVTYQWIDCNNGNSVIIGETNQSFITTSTGNYAVVITKNSCSDTSACVNITTVGLENFSNTAGFLKIYPNPTNGEFQIETSDVLCDAKLQILNSIGQNILQINLNKQKNIFNLYEFEEGLYTIRIITESKVTTVKLIKR